MRSLTLAPCGIICDICLGFQRTKNQCAGCTAESGKPKACMNCIIVKCPEKGMNPKKFCSKCRKYPCRRIKDLDKRYRIKYGESIIENLHDIEAMGRREFGKLQKKKWTCPSCGTLLCVHREMCLSCGAVNPLFPAQSLSASRY